ncbi:hypothetical protein DYQ86_20010 [Acidobacteria bacterium AB60]|nr:hypothetical protein DYQ86_20010 [Acidobacteria bacterium AB60]
MILTLIEAAVRSLIVGLAVFAALRLFRIRNVVAQKVALELVLIGAISMPLLLPVAERLQVLPAETTIVLPARPMTLLEELQARILAGVRSGKASQTDSAPSAIGNSAASGELSRPAGEKSHAPRGEDPGQPGSSSDDANGGAANRSVTGEEGRPWSGRMHASVSFSVVGWSIYLAISMVLLGRLVLGLAMTLRLWLTAEPISAQELPGTPGNLRLRCSRGVASPLTIGSGVLLPLDYRGWGEEKLRIVLAHERSHIRQGDYYLQLLASLYTALFWFSPLGWWLKRELAELAEAISDRAGTEEARTPTDYAAVLLEFAAASRPTAFGVAMARPGSLARRIERLLNDDAFRQSFARGHRVLVAVALVPTLMISATALVRVHAAPQARIAAAALPVPHGAVLPAVETLTSETPSAAFSEPKDPPERESEATTIAQSEGSSLSFERTLQVGGDAQLTVSTGSGSIHLTRSSGSEVRIRGQIHVHENGSEELARRIAANPPIEQSGEQIRVGQQHEEHWNGISIDYQIEAPAGTKLVANSGSGEIVDEGVGRDAKLETGSGEIRANSLEGSFVLKTGSGDIKAEQTGEGEVDAETGSGNIEIKDIHGSFRAQTGSGDIKATGTPSAPWKLETGSGNVEIWSGNAPLNLDASTGSGSMITDHEMLVKGSMDHHHITGTLNGGGPLVRIETGSGDVRVH